MMTADTLLRVWGPTVALLGGLALTNASSVEAQTSQKVSIQVSGLGQSFFGSDFEGINAGLGAEAQLRYNHSSFSIGGGVQYTTHSSSVEGLSVDAIGAFLEPRYVVDMGSDKAAPYISGRFAITDFEFDDDTQGNLGTESGITVNGGGGLLYRMGPRLNLDFGATFGFQRIGIIGESLTGSNQGTNIVFRAGVAYGLGG
ncbi:MAG: hypothetical protein ACR2QM_05755 [Longimicrobiales bacterium]